MCSILISPVAITMSKQQQASELTVGAMPKRVFETARKPSIDLPDLIEPQRESYKWFVDEALKEVFKEFTPITDYSEKKFELLFKKY